MDLIASFSSQKVNTFNFFVLHGLLGDDDLIFLFDTGAICPVVGVNNFFREVRSDRNRNTLERILHNEIDVQGIVSRPVPLKTANNQEVSTYPCVCHHVSIENSTERDFFFDISFDDISIPLLGSSFIDDCAYSHAINGNLNITGMKPQAGVGYYSGRNVLDFDKVAAAFAQTTSS